MFSQSKFLEIELATNSLKFDHFTLLDNALYYKNLLWVPTTLLKKEVIVTCHDHVLSGHLGIFGTMLLIKQDYVWFGIEFLVVLYIKYCNLYNRNKLLIIKPTGLLMPLQILDTPWSSISIDLITNFLSQMGLQP